MKHKIILRSALLAGFCLAATLAANAQLGDRENKELLFIDLITDGVSYKTLDDKQVKVAVRNLGSKEAINTSLRFEFTKDGKTMTKSIGIVRLGPKSIIWIPISLGVNLYLAKYCVTIDPDNKVKEIKEDNNTRCGDFGGKP